MDESVDGAVAFALHMAHPAAQHDLGRQPHRAARDFGHLRLHDGCSRVADAVLALEDGVDVGGGQLLAGVVHDSLHDLAELNLQAARQLQAVLGFEQVGDAALA